MEEDITWTMMNRSAQLAETEQSWSHEAKISKRSGKERGQLAAEHEADPDGIWLDPYFTNYYTALEVQNVI